MKHEDTSDIFCPYCDEAYNDEMESDYQYLKCPHCGKWFMCSAITLYSTREAEND